MIDNKRLLLTVTSLAIIGVLALVAYSTSLGALELGIGDIDRSHEGSVVATAGTVTSARTFPDGSVSLGLSDMNTSATVSLYIAGDVAGSIANSTLLPGAVLSVRGEVSFYLESPEIRVSRAGDIVLLAEPGTSEYGLATVMGAINLFDGIEITTSGEILDMRVISSSGETVGTGFRLRNITDNQTYYLDCICYGRDLTSTHVEWQSVRVTGAISYYRNQGRWQMTAEIVQ